MKLFLTLVTAMLFTFGAMSFASACDGQKKAQVKTTKVAHCGKCKGDCKGKDCDHKKHSKCDKCSGKNPNAKCTCKKDSKKS